MILFLVLQGTCFPYTDEWCDWYKRGAWWVTLRLAHLGDKWCWRYKRRGDIFDSSRDVEHRVIRLEGLFWFTVEEISLWGLFWFNVEKISLWGLFRFTVEELSLGGLFRFTVKEISLGGLFRFAVKELSLGGLLFCGWFDREMEFDRWITLKVEENKIVCRVFRIMCQNSS